MSSTEEAREDGWVCLSPEHLFAWAERYSNTSFKDLPLMTTVDKQPGPMTVLRDALKCLRVVLKERDCGGVNCGECFECVKTDRAVLIHHRDNLKAELLRAEAALREILNCGVGGGDEPREINIAHAYFARAALSPKGQE